MIIMKNNIIIKKTSRVPKKKEKNARINKKKTIFAIATVPFAPRFKCRAPAQTRQALAT